TATAAAPPTTARAPRACAGTTMRAISGARASPAPRRATGTRAWSSRTPLLTSTTAARKPCATRRRAAARASGTRTASRSPIARAVPSGMLCWNIAFVDFDFDGSVDVVANGTFIGAQWVRNDHGLWADEVDAVEQAYVTDIDWADYDGDGKMDAAVARYEDSM